MKIIASEKTRESINNEYKLFMADPNNLARLKMKLTFNQRIFIEALQEAYASNTSQLNAEDKLLLLQEAILAFNARPELVPDAPIDTMKKNVTFKGSPDDFEQMLVLIKIWRSSLIRARRPINRLSMFFAKWNKTILYPFFVAALTATFTSILTTGATYLIFNQLDYMHLAEAVVAGFISIAAGRGIYFRVLAENVIQTSR